MRHLKVMGLAAIAVFALVAFAGATTASATRLCSTNTTPCANVYPNDTTFTSHLETTAVLTTSGGVINPTVVCHGSTLGLTNSNQGGGEGVDVAVRLTALSFTTCESSTPPGCGTTATIGSLTNSTGTISYTSLMNGTLRLTPPLVGFHCPTALGVVLCTFGGSGTLDGTITGGNPATIEFSSQTLASIGGFGCPTASHWSAQYRTTVPLFVTTN